MTPAERQRAYRARRKVGRMVVRLEIDDVATPEALVAGGYLAACEMEDASAITRALQRAVAELRPAFIPEGDA